MRVSVTAPVRPKVIAVIVGIAISPNTTPFIGANMKPFEVLRRMVKAAEAPAMEGKSTLLTVT